MTPSRLQELADRAWQLFDHAIANANSVVVLPSIPILYFGDSGAYRSSPVKIVTVGLNPSRKEFPSTNPWSRFPGGGRHEAYLATLDAYFRTDPYMEWFEAFEPVLKGMGASYRTGAENIALHTDICSPVATTPTWSKLRKERPLLGDGFTLWRDLVETLAPDVVLVSVARQHLIQLTPESANAWPTVVALDRAHPYQVRMLELSIGQHRVPVVFGRAAQKPFGTVASRDKVTIGAAIRKALDAR